MHSITITFILLVLTNTVFGKGIDSIPSNQELGILSMELYFDNDFIFGRTDEDYTTGLRFKTTLESFRFKIPFLFGFAHESGAAQSLRPLDLTVINNFQNIELGLNYFTPKKIDTIPILYTERPYSSNQYVGIGRISVKKKYKRSFLNETSYQKIATQINLGLTGGPAAGNLQRAFHKLNGSKTPMGWHNQIGGTRNLIYANYQLGYDVLITGSDIKLNTSRFDTRIFGVYNTYQFINTLFLTNLNVGTMMNDVSFGFQWNFFNFNKHNEYYLKYYENKTDLFPHNNSHFIRSTNSLRIEELESVIEQDFPTAVTGLQDSALNVIMKHFIELLDGGLMTINMFRFNMNAKQNSLLMAGPLNPEQIDTLTVLNLILRSSDDDLSRKVNFYRHHISYINPYFDFKVFIRPELKFVAHNGNLQGPLLYDNSQDYTIRYINPLLISLSAGAEFRFNSMALRVSYHLRSREVPAQCNQSNIFDTKACDPDFLLDLKLFHQWGNISIICYPSMILKHNEQKAYKKRMNI